MKKITRTYVKFYFGGGMVSETYVMEVNTRDPKLVDMPSGSYAFMFYDREFIVDGEDEFKGRVKNKSPDYYPKGTIYNQDEVKKLRNHTILLNNMRINRWDRVIKSRYGNFEPYEEGETVII